MKNKANNNTKRIAFVITIIVGILIVFALTKQIISALESGKRLDQSADKVTNLQAENRKLKQSLEKAEEIGTIEEILRDDLNMGLPNETIVVVPEELIKKTLEGEKPPPEVKIPNWQRWLKLFI